jgi:uncharacterized protein YacL (UPF0231 family)
MVMMRYSYEEMILLRLLELNSLMPHYWSELFLLSFQLFDPKSEQYEALQQMIQDVEIMVLDDNQLEAGFSLYDIEMALESNPDYYSFIEKNDGSVITKFDVERRLNNIKSWIYANVRERAVGRKFQRYR